MPKRVNPGNKADQSVTFRLQDAQRIAKVVRAYESDPRQAKASKLPRAVGGGGGGGVQKAFFQGQWLKGQEKIITLMSGTSTVSTTRCSNFIVDVLYSDSNRKCFVIAEDPPGFTLMIPECIN